MPTARYLWIPPALDQVSRQLFQIKCHPVAMSARAAIFCRDWAEFAELHDLSLGELAQLLERYFPEQES